MYDFQEDFQTLVIREWRGFWQEDCQLPTKPAGGYALTFHKGTQPAYHVEFYSSIEEIKDRYRCIWLARMPGDSPDIVIVGIPERRIF